MLQVNCHPEQRTAASAVISKRNGLPVLYSWAESYGRLRSGVRIPDPEHGPADRGCFIGEAKINGYPA
jgi:hypothetical protein